MDEVEVYPNQILQKVDDHLNSFSHHASLKQGNGLPILLKDMHWTTVS